MQRSKATKETDAVTLRQFERYLPSAEIHPKYKGKINKLADVLLMPVFLQDKLVFFA